MLKILNSFMLIALLWGQSCSAQSQEELIIGTWEGTKKELRNGETGEKYTLDGKPYKHINKIKFNKDLTGYDIYEDASFTYSFEDEFFYIGNRTYVLEKLTTDELVIREYDKYTPDDPMAIRLYFKRIN